jgi:preprotein translocase subunit SecB
MSEAAAPEQNQPTFNIEKLYVKDMSLEVPHAPSIYLEREVPEIDMQLHTEFSAIDEGIFEVVITSTLTAKMSSIKDKVMFLIEVQQAGVFHVRNIPQEEMESVLAVVCPNILYPYLREVVTDLSVRGGFAPVLLNPVNFEALYKQQKAQAGADVTKH